MQSLIRQLITVGILSFVALVTTVQAQSDGATIYKAHCALCHSADGSADNQTGKSLHAKDLRSEEFRKKTDASSLMSFPRATGQCRLLAPCSLQRTYTNWWTTSEIWQRRNNQSCKRAPATGSTSFRQR